MAIGSLSGSLLWFLNSRQCIARGIDNFPTVGGYEDDFFSLFLALEGARGTPGGTEVFAVLKKKFGPPMYKVCLEQSAS